ncbi:hypothetical protein SPHFLASMR4Y_01759 [Sphingorhabdus sp. SMR4y]|nr:hypothetical protein SPHFLASMR4Y_01759 [Sphingorhabdus sp. SMR4y]
MKHEYEMECVSIYKSPGHLSAKFRPEGDFYTEVHLSFENAGEWDVGDKIKVTLERLP